MTDTQHDVTRTWTTVSEDGGPGHARVDRLTPEQLETFGQEMDAIRQRVLGELGEDDATYIRGVVKVQHRFELAGRALFYVPPAWPLAVAAPATRFSTSRSCRATPHSKNTIRACCRAAG